MPYDTSQLIKNKEGMVQIGEKAFVNPNYLSQEGFQQARSFANLPITSKDLTPVPEYELPTPRTPTAAPNAIVSFGVSAEQTAAQNASQQRVDEAVKMAEAKKTQREKDILSAQQKILDVQAKRPGYEQEQDLTGKAQAQNAARQQVNAFNAQLISEQRALQKRRETIFSNGSLTTGQAQAQYNAEERQSASKQADISLSKLVAQNAFENATFDLTTAQSIVQHKLDVELEPLKQKLEFNQFWDERNTKYLDKAEQRQWEIIKTNDQRNYDQTKTDLTTANSYLLKAGENGATLPVFQSIQQAINDGRYDEARNLASPYLQSPTAGLDRQYKLGQISLQEAQLRKLQLENVKLVDELNPTGDIGVSQDLEAYGSQYADTGKLPSVAELKLSGLSVGQVTSYAKQLPKPSGALVSLSTGSKSSALSPAQEDGILALYDISQKVGQLKELEAQRIKGLTSATLGKIFGSTAQENYINLRTEIIDLLARARTGAALTVQEEKFYTDQLPGRIGQLAFGLLGPNTQNKINNFGTKIQGTLNTKLKGQGVGIYGFSKVKVGGIDRTIGEIIDIGGQQYRVLPDGTLTDII